MTNQTDPPILCTNLASFFKERQKIVADQTIGFVPTMGNLHQGHISLVEMALRENQHVIVSIFVNPTQFAKDEDLDTYPRTLQQDQQKLYELSKKNPDTKIIILAPEDATELYPDGKKITVQVGELTGTLCGKSRPRHFDGVTTIVDKLFQITGPTTAYFGEKDYQQQIIIKKMVMKYGHNVKIKALPIVRDQQGLALSSRNQNLSKEDYQQALILPRSLSLVKKNILHQGMASFAKFKQKFMTDKRWEYLELRDATTLHELTPNSKKLIILGAFKVNGTRLIDNIYVALE